MSVKYSVIIPVYNEEKVLAQCYKEVKKTAEQFDDAYEIIFINDGSHDQSLDMLKTIAKNDKTIKVISFSRNFGHQPAVTAGMKEARGQALIILDADLQDPPEVVHEMIKKWKEGYDIVYGKRSKRAGEKLLKKFTAFLYYRFLARITGLKIPKDTGDFRLIAKKAADAIINMPEKNRYLRGMNTWVGFKQIEVLYERQSRVAGETKYTMKKMVKLASDGIISNTNYPLTFIFNLGLFFGVLSVLGYISVLTLQLTHIISNIVYWLFPSLGLCLSVTLMALGIIGIYLGRVYDEVKDRPVYIISEKINFD